MRRVGAWAAFCVLTSALAAAAGSGLGERFTQPDASWYVMIAKGDAAGVLEPFRSRPLGPWVARGLGHVFGRGPGGSFERGFLIEGVLALVLLSAVLGWLLVESGAEAWVLACVGGLAFWAELFNGLALPDLGFAALLVVFLLLLERGKFLAAALMLFPLFVSRESAVLVLVVLLVVGWGALRAAGSVTAVAASVAGAMVVRVLTPPGGANQEKMGAVAYLAGKVPWNFAKNILGLPLWSNLNHGSCDVPRWQRAVHFGAMDAVGVCGFSPAVSLWTLRMAMCSFGLLPLILLFAWRWGRGRLWPKSVMLRFCVVYGGVSFVLAPVLGSSVPRLFGYAWPLFLVAVPVMAVRRRELSRGSKAVLAGLHLGISWSAAVHHFGGLGLVDELGSVITIAACYGVGWWVLLRMRPHIEMRTTA